MSGQVSASSYNIVGLGYVSLYVQDMAAAAAFYGAAFGPPQDDTATSGGYAWRMGATWLTVFPCRAGTCPDSNPCNVEFAIQVSAPPEVDQLYRALLQAGAKDCMAPSDTSMYEPMRFACVDDPFGVRIDVYCPLTDPPTQT